MLKNRAKPVGSVQRRAATAFPEVEDNNNFDTANVVALSSRPGGTAAFDLTGSITATGGSPVTFTTKAEDNGSIPLATESGFAVGPGTRTTTSAISTTPSTGDYDFVKFTANAGQSVVLSTAGSAFDTVLTLYSSTGTILGQNDDVGGGNLTSRVQVTLPANGDYYACVGGFNSSGFNPSDPFNSASGPGIGSSGNYTLSIALDTTDQDFFAFDLDAGDVLGASLVGTPNRLEFYSPERELRMGSSQATTIQPASSPLPDTGNVIASFVAEKSGRFFLRVGGTTGTYTTSVSVFRPGLQRSAEPIGTRNILFLDFNGATLDTSIFGASGTRTLSPLSSFLASWGLTAADENAVIDAIVESVRETLDRDLRTRATNGDFNTTGRPGDFAIQILNSRDDADPWGQPNVSRIIIGGTRDQLGISTIGIAESIDVGNFDTSETAVVLLDLLSAAASDGNSLNQYGVQAPATKIQLIGQGVGNITAHEAGHFYGLWHTNQFNAAPCIIDQGGNLDNTVGVGLDAILGTADDVDVDFIADQFVPAEGFSGTQATFAAMAFGLSTAGTPPIATTAEGWMLY